MKLPLPKKKGNKLPPPKPRKFRAHIQDDLLGGLDADKHKSDYTSKILAPIYEPKNKKPDIFELVDQSKSNALIVKIMGSGISLQEKNFLIEAAKRHNIFNYKLIADYYAHAPATMQALMEQSALVIIDFDKAIQNGFVKYSEEIKELYVNEFAAAKK